MEEVLERRILKTSLKPKFFGRDLLADIGRNKLGFYKGMQEEHGDAVAVQLSPEPWFLLRPEKPINLTWGGAVMARRGLKALFCAGVWVCSTTQIHAAQECLSLRVIATYDTNLSLSIDRKEFQQLALFRFDTADADGDGIVRFTDLPAGSKYHPTLRRHAKRDASGTEWLDRTMFQRSLDGFFAFVDRDGNGGVSLREYRKLCREGWYF